MSQTLARLTTDGDNTSDLLDGGNFVHKLVDTESGTQGGKYKGVLSNKCQGSCKIAKKV